VKGVDKKAIVAAYKERKTAQGIYAVRCVPTGQRWVGRTADLAAAENRIRFTLRHGGGLFCALRAARLDHGAEAFAFEEIERFDDEALAKLGDRGLKERLAYWCKTLDAEPI
jgi:murein tripeptide amidase MpaA